MLSESTVQSAIETNRPSLLARVADFRVRVGRDSTDDLAVWVTLVLDDDVLEHIWDRRDELRLQVEEIVRSEAADYWPYVSFQATSEQRQAATS